MNRELEEVAKRLMVIREQSERMKREVPHLKVEEDYDFEPSHYDYYEEQRYLREQAHEGMADAFDLDYYDDGEDYDSFDWRD